MGDSVSPARLRVSTEEIVAAYQQTGSVWKAALILGLAGQSVHERLAAIDFPMGGRRWTSEEVDELRRLAGNLPIGEIAERLGRPYAGVACKISEVGVSGRVPGRREPKRGSGYNKESVAKHKRDLIVSNSSIRQFCVARGLSIDNLVTAFERYEGDWWQEWRAAHSMLPDRQCSYCSRAFTPMTKKQEFCSRKCGVDKKRDETYFNGNRRSTIGLAESVCQLCGKTEAHGLSSHHVVGKEHDPEAKVLIALCPGCHQIVGQLSNRRFLREEKGWEALISLCWFRQNGDRGTDQGVHVCVDIDAMTPEEPDEDAALQAHP